MKTYRIAAALILALTALAGCSDDDGGSTPRDSGTGGIDANLPATDSGPAPDGGATGTDAGPGGACPSGACDLLDNGCASGEGCYFLSPSAGAAAEPICQPTGTGTSGTSCADYRDCGPGYFCLSPSGGGAGQCVHYCCDNDDSGCPSGERCAVQLSGVGGAPTGVGYCRGTDNCNLVTQTGCPSGQGCYLTSRAATDDSRLCIASNGNVAIGGACEGANDCAPGGQCFAYPTPTSARTCHEFCDPMATTSTCESSEMCLSLGVTVLPNAGICVPRTAGGDAGVPATDAGTIPSDAGTAAPDAT